MPGVIRFGVSRKPPDVDNEDDGAFLDTLVAKGHTAHELAFVTGFPWKEKRCRSFGEQAAERGIWLSVHAPYFAVLTVEEEDKAKQCLAALEHTMKLGKALGSRIVCAHFGNTHGLSGDELLERVRTRLAYVAPKVEGMGVGLGLEVAGNDRNFGTLGDIALLADEFSFVRPIVDWAHVHAMTGGALTSREAFTSVIQFLRDSFPGWMIEPLQTQFTDTQFNEHGEIRHIAYGSGSLKVGPLVEAASAENLSMVVISEAREESSHRHIGDEIRATLNRLDGGNATGRPLGSGAIEFPEVVKAVKEGKNFRPGGLGKPLMLSNLDKPFFPEGYTKGDLVQYYASVASALLPHLEGRAIVMSRYPDGIGGGSFYEKRAPRHQPEWMTTAPVYTDSRHGSIEYLLATNRESLMWFANMGCIEIHPWHSRVSTPENPDYAIFDFDPAEGATWDQIVAGAKLLRVALDRLDLKSYPKLSGSKGLHVYVPVDPVYNYGRIRGFVEAVGRLLVSANGQDLTMEWDIPRRRGKVFIDHNRNAYGQTIASVYSVRPLPGGPVSAPITWEEVDTVRNGDITMSNLFDRLQRFGDLFALVPRGGQRLESAEAAMGMGE